MHIRDAIAADATAIAGIYNDAVLNSTASFDVGPRTPEDRVQWLATRTPVHPVLVLEIEDDIAGWGALSPYSDRRAYAATAELSVYVAAPYRGRGVGPSLARALIEHGRASALHVVLARICTENEASIAMVRMLGFTEAGTMHEVGRKFDRWLDVVTWEYNLGEPCIATTVSGDILK